MVPRPDVIFDRTQEWSDLDGFVSTPRNRLAVVLGARRVGKSFLTYSFCNQANGFYVQATRGDPSLALGSLGEALGERLRAPAPLKLSNWRAAVDALLTLPDTPMIVLDEFPYWVESSPDLPTVLQAALDQNRLTNPEAGNKLVLCGSAASQMSRLLADDGPLYRRAQLALTVRPFDLRTASDYWGLKDRPTEALRVYTIVGGMPGYKDVLGPVDNVDTWVINRVLNPGTSLFYEDDLVFATDPDLPDSNVYRSVLTAIARGESTTTGIASRIGRKVTSLSKVIDRLMTAGLIVRTPDPLRSKRSRIDLADPFLRFHYAIIQPNRAALARRRSQQVWERSKATFQSQVLGPGFEQLCRDALLDYDDLGFPIPISGVGSTKLHDPVSQRDLDVDVVGLDEQGTIVLLGEAKATNAVRTQRDLRRLEHLRTLLPPHRRDPDVHLALFSLNGTDKELAHEAARRQDVTLIDAATLFGH